MAGTTFTSRRLLSLFKPLLLLAAMTAVATAAVADDPPLVTSVRVEATGPADEQAIAKTLELEVGSPLDRGRLREIITTLYAGGDVEWLRIESTENPDGVDVVIKLNYRSTISDIRVRAKSPVMRVKIHRWLQLAIGDPITAARIEVSRRRVERRLQERGYAEARVDAYLDYRRKSNTVFVEIEVLPGPRQVLDRVVVDGLGDEDLAAEVQPKAKAGARLTARLEDRIQSRTEENLRRMGFWEAEVMDVEREADGASVNLVLHVDPGRRYRLDLQTSDEHSKLAEQAFPDPADGDIHPAQTEALAEEVQEKLQEEGFLLARVQAELSTDGDDQVLHLGVEPGDKLSIADVVFPGADSLQPQRLADAVLVKPGKTGSRFNQKISTATLEADRKALVDLYHREGFPFVEVGAAELLRAAKPTAVRVAFPITEGQHWIVDTVRVEGLPVETAADLETTPLGLVDGSPWSPGAVKRGKARIEQALADTGYPEGRVAADADTSRPGKAAVVYRIDPGAFVKVGDIIIAGLIHTSEPLVAGVVRRAGVRPGEPLSRARMLEAQRGLYELGIFRRVEVVPMPGHERRAERNIVVRCEEGEQKSYLFGIGYSNVDAARVILGWSHLNLFGRAYGFAAEASLSNRQQQYSLSLRKRRAFGLPVPGYLAVYRTDEVLADRDLVRRGLWIDFGDRLKRPLRPWLRYEYEIIQADNLPPGVEPTAGNDIEESKVASITPSIEWDTRDNPLAPVKGVFASASAQYAFPVFLADEHFFKVRVGGTVYKPMWRGFAAAGLRIGAIKPFDDTPNLPDNLEIPFAYRFFAGGRTTHRAFDTDALGIPGRTLVDGKPVGGNALVLLNFEYRRRMVGDLFAAVFVDAGNVWASPSDVDLGDIRWGAGISLQYWTPAGPLRAEYGWKLDPEHGEPGGQFFISFGVPF